MVCRLAGAKPLSEPMLECWNIVNSNFRKIFSEILSEIQSFSFKKRYLKMSSAQWRLICLGLNMFTLWCAVALCCRCAWWFIFQGLEMPCPYNHFTLSWHISEYFEDNNCNMHAYTCIYIYIYIYNIAVVYPVIEEAITYLKLIFLVELEWNGNYIPTNDLCAII